MCSPDTIDTIDWDGHDEKKKKQIEDLRARLTKRREQVQGTLDEIKKRFPTIGP
jgi:hypothetical protein